jgi:hypothetical protein
MRNLAKRIVSAIAALARRSGVIRSKVSERDREKSLESQPARKLSPEEVLDVILEWDLHDEAERVAALSNEELERELVEAGCDLEKLRAFAADIFARARQRATVEKAADRESDVRNSP